MPGSGRPSALSSSSYSAYFPILVSSPRQSKLCPLKDIPRNNTNPAGNPAGFFSFQTRVTCLFSAEMARNMHCFPWFAAVKLLCKGSEQFMGHKQDDTMSLQIFWDPKNARFYLA